MIIKAGSQQVLEDKHLKITWNLLNFCNFHCPYCLNSNNHPSINLQSIDKLNYGIRNILSLDYNSFEIYLLGGEPTLHPYFEYIMDKLLENEKVKRLYVMTNGSNIVQYPFDKERLKVNVSIHPLEYKKIGIKKNNENIYFNLLAYPKMWDKVIDIYNNEDIDEITVVRKPPNFEEIYEYTEEQKSWLLEHDKNKIKEATLYKASWFFDTNPAVVNQPKYSFLEFNQETYMAFKDMYCFGNNLIIHDDGTYQSGCYSSKRSNSSIYESRIKFKPQMIQCHYKYCNCAGRMNLMKIRDKEEAEEMFSKFGGRK